MAKNNGDQKKKHNQKRKRLSDRVAGSKSSIDVSGKSEIRIENSQLSESEIKLLNQKLDELTRSIELNYYSSNIELEKALQKNSFERMFSYFFSIKSRLKKELLEKTDTTEQNMAGASDSGGE